MPSVELIMLAVRAGIKLAAIAKKGFITSTRQGALTFPLPDTFYSPNLGSVGDYYSVDGKGAVYLVEGSRLVQLYQKFLNSEISQPESEELLTIYREHKALNSTLEGPHGQIELTDGTVIEMDAWNALLTVRQYERGEIARQNRKLFHILAGTLVEVGVDYFATVPGALNENSRHGKVFKAFILALDKIPFAELEYDQGWLTDLGERFLIATLETVSTHPELIASDPNIERLVHVTTFALSKDVKARLEEIGEDEKKKRDLKNWAEIIFASVLSSAGGEVVKNPSRYLGLIAGEIDEYDSEHGKNYAVAIEKVGSAFLDLAVAEGDLTLHRIIGHEGIDTMVKAAFAAVAENPNLIGIAGTDTLNPLVIDIARSLSQTKERLTIEMMPELFRIVLEKSGLHMDLIWAKYIEDPSAPENHLLVTAAKKTIAILSRKPQQGQWQPLFTGDEMLLVTETVLDELANNPSWLLMKAAELDKTLEAALGSTLKVIRERGDRRLSTDVVLMMLESAIVAAAMRIEFVEKAEIIKEPLIAAAAGTILSVILDTSAENQKVQWQILRTEALVTVFRSGLLALAKHDHLDHATVEKLRSVLENKVRNISAGKSLDLERIEVELSEALNS